MYSTIAPFDVEVFKAIPEDFMGSSAISDAVNQLMSLLLTCTLKDLNEKMVEIFK